MRALGTEAEDRVGEWKGRLGEYACLFCGEVRLSDSRPEQEGAVGVEDGPRRRGRPPVPAKSLDDQSQLLTSGHRAPSEDVQRVQELARAIQHIDTSKAGADLVRMRTKFGRCAK